MPVDLRSRKLAKLVVNYCMFVKPGENVIISGGSEAEPFIVDLYKETILAGGHPFIKMTPQHIEDFFYTYAKKHQIEHFPEYWFTTVKSAQKYIGIDTDGNTKELSSVNSEKITARKRTLHPISEYVVNEKPKIYRVTVGYPCLAHAIEADMSLTEWENFVYGACLQDWQKLSRRLKQINAVFERGKTIHLIGENVDLRFSIAGKNSVLDDGKENMPGGEIFMAPVRESMQGWIRFEYPAIRDGKEVTNIFLRFERGKVVEAKADKNEEFLNTMLRTDTNASYVGEFGVGCNPHITRFTKNLLFDEKIGGTIHLALGSAYKENGGGNDSAIHWDIVKSMKKARIVVDSKVVQDRGIWKI